MNSGDTEGRVVDGRFALEARLGDGSMGTVWRAHDLVLDRPVALKEVRPPDPGLAEHHPEAARALRARVLREARALARVDHPHVVTIYHVVNGEGDGDGDTDVDGAGDTGYPWLVMELVTGGSLRERLAEGPMEPAAVARLGRDVLAGLRAAHGAGIQHRDVKPGNVLLRPDGRPVLTDFGVAALHESAALTVTGALMGTPEYMAPERIAGADGGPESDLWSLAMMLYVAVEGRHPLRRRTTMATLAAVLKEELPPPRRAGPLTGVLTALLVKDPAARPDAETVDAMLAAAVAAPPPRTAVPTPTPTPTQASEPAPTLPPTRRGAAPRRLVIGLSLVVAALTAALVWALLPGADSTGDADTGVAAPSAGVPGRQTPEAREPQKAKKAREPADLLTPDGIRQAVTALKAETGTARVGGFVVYPAHISAQAMVKGSEKRYDTYTYRVGQGVSRAPIGGTLMDGQLPVEMDTFDWDAVPELLRRADRDLKVDRPTSRYLLIRPPNELFGSAAGLTVYLTDDYGTGYLEADSGGRVTRVVPAGS
ncbi:serine/threonine-protein kinase [Streptomyces paludis]|uniref:non-specific serine/threonine protein kinase n=1 Tax=Streptomyces paludis TaxID=2282738 RepID=A0A345I280_9ACTN|nr:serine/threonine-protein kinase [Streptomyces paludis]AXG83054.1 serine/threonine protein kinase [Streptomyces paludis]